MRYILKKHAFTLCVLLMFLFFAPGGAAWGATFSGDGSGTATDPYIITTAAQLDEARNFLDSHFKLENDIDLTDYLAESSAGWLPIGTNTDPFTGGFDGNNKKITELWIDQTDEDYLGLFGRASNATISNLGVEISAAGVSGKDYIGSLLGYQVGGSITDCCAAGNITATGIHIGGLVGYLGSGGNIIDSYAAGDITTTEDFVGGLVGYQDSYSQITTSYATGNVSGASNTGGLVGYQTSDSQITSCHTAGNVSGRHYVGGLVGRQASDSQITTSYATGSITATGNSTGGLVGYQASDSQIMTCYATSNIISTGDNAGGLVGYQYEGSITNSYATGDVSSVGNIGGLVGYQTSSSQITNSFATGNIVSTGDNSGGLAGYQDGGSSIENCYAMGNITSTGENTGGLVGNQSSDSTITNSYRYIYLTINGDLISTVDPSGNHGGVRNLTQFKTQSTYSDSTTLGGGGWLFNPYGPWHWDDEGFPKLNMGVEENPFVTGTQEATATLKVSFQGRTAESPANVEMLTVKWIKDGVVISPEQTTATNENGEAPITLP